MKYLHPALIRMCLFIIMAVFPAMKGYSQESGSCAENLRMAQTLFEKGQVEQVPSLLRDCLKSGFNREESLEAYKLIIQSYLFEEKLELADSTMLAFLKKNPEYQISPTDHSSFVSLFNNFVSKVIIQVSFHFGTSLPFVTVTESRPLSGIPSEKKYSTDALNLFAAVEVKYKINEKTELSAEAGYSRIAFSNKEDFMGIGEISYRENQKRIEIPVSVSYNFASIGIFTPYARLGIGPSFIFSSVAQSVVEPADENNPYDHSGKDINMHYRRISADLFTQAGAGIKLKTREGFIFGEFRTCLGLFNQSKGGGYSDGDDLAWFYYHADDRFRLNSLNFNLGYTRIFYKPSRKKD